MFSELKKKSLAGVKWTALAAVLVALIQVVQIVVLAKFLSPQEYGVWGILSVLVGFSNFFVDVGVSNAVIHYQTIDTEELSSLYWLNVLAGFGVFLVLSLSAPFFAWFYRSE